MTDYNKCIKCLEVKHVSEFKNHIESNFLNGMSWDNRSLWQIDHKIPISVAKTIDEIILLNHFTNLRPLWTYQNQNKKAKLDWVLSD